MPITAMILAAGRGERMRPLTDFCPKPLLSAAGQPLILRHLLALRDAGCRQMVINLGHMGSRIPMALGDGRRWGLQLRYSVEVPPALETAGGIAHALPLMGSTPFVVVNGDTWTDYPRAQLLAQAEQMQHSQDLAHLVLVPNPEHHPQGDFACIQGRAQLAATGCLTFSGMAVYQPQLFASVAPDRASKLAPLLRQAMQDGRVSAESYTGHWMDIGTPERLHQLHHQLSAAPASAL